MVDGVVLVHGAWMGGWSWAGVQAELDRRGIPSYAPDLPGRGTSPLPLGDLYADAAYVADLLRRRDGNVVLVGHSYGGAVMSEAVPTADNVAHLVYVTGFCLDVGEAFLQVRRSITDDERMAAATRRAPDRALVVVEPGAAREVLFASAPEAVASAAVSRLEPQLVKTFSQPVTAAPWRRLRATYVRCSEDAAIPLAVQDAMAAHCGSVVTLPTDHSPHLSAPGPLAELIAAIAMGSDPAAAG